MKRRNAVLIVLLLLPLIYVSFSNLTITYDDAFITYRYAYNLASGNGFVYNQGERFLGTSAPLYGLILGALGWITKPDLIPLLSGIISAISLVACCFALFTYSFREDPWSGFFAGLFFLLNPFTVYSFGGEMLLQLGLLLWSFVLYRKNSTKAAAVLVSLAILVRIDAASAAFVLFLHYCITRRTVPIRETAIAAALIIPCLILSYGYYGSWLPSTIAAKLAQRDSGLWETFLKGFVVWMHAQLQFKALLLFWFVGGIAVLFRHRSWLFPLSWVVLFSLVYAAVRMPYYHWYGIPGVAGLSILAGCACSTVIQKGIDLATRWKMNPKLSGILFPALCIGAIGMLYHGSIHDLAAVYRCEGCEKLYPRVGVWLNKNTPSSCSVGYLEIGYIGYYAHRRIIDPIGLVNAGESKHVAARDFLSAYERMRPDYIIYNENFKWTGELLRAPWFSQNYHLVKTFSDVHYPFPLLLYALSGAPPPSSSKEVKE